MFSSHSRIIFLFNVYFFFLCFHSPPGKGAPGMGLVALAKTQRFCERCIWLLFWFLQTRCPLAALSGWAFVCVTVHGYSYPALVCRAFMLLSEYSPPVIRALVSAWVPLSWGVFTWRVFCLFWFRCWMCANNQFKTAACLKQIFVFFPLCCKIAQLWKPAVWTK